MDASFNVAPYIAFALTLICIWYLYEVMKSKYLIYITSHIYDGPDSKEQGVAEGFQDSTSNESKDFYTWITNPQDIYDDFYVHIYDELLGQTKRTMAKVDLCINIWNSQDPISTWSVLDAGSGTGVAACYFAKKGAGNVIAIDHSTSMMTYAQNETTKKLELSDKEKGNRRWRQESLINPSACSAGEATHLIMFYFTFYYMNNQEECLRHLNFWSKPGAKLALEVVNKYKFDPILEAASPFLGFSIQKYSEERVRKSRVTFDKFEYDAEFMLTGDKGDFYETFRFKNNHVRRQKHIFHMPEIKKIVKIAETAGWNYKGYQDLNPLGFEYGYLLFFEKN